MQVQLMSEEEMHAAFATETRCRMLFGEPSTTATDTLDIARCVSPLSESADTKDAGEVVQVSSLPAHIHLSRAGR